MVNPIQTTLRAERWFYAFLFIHLIVWTLIPTWVRFTLPLDTIEGAIWGHQLEWGYDKNPFMNAWLTALAFKLAGTSSWIIYLFCQFSVVACFWAVWQLGKKMLPPIYALLGVMLLEFMQYYNFHALDLNDNTLELGFWALTILFFYQALTEKKWRDWILTGVFSALGLMTKYYMAILLLPMFLFMLINAKAREQFRNPAFYASFIIFLLIIAPHFIWLFSHNFITVTYVFERVSSPPSWANHIVHPAAFASQQFQVLLPALIMMFVLCIGEKPKEQLTINPKPFDKQFLYFMGLGPFLLTVLLSIVTGIKLRSAWGQPLLSLWGLLFLIWVKPQITLERFYRFIVLFYVLFAVMVAGYCAAFIRADKPSTANYPGKNIAEFLTKQWEQKYHQPLHYVAGSRWLAGNIAFYSPDRPSVYINWDKNVSFWIDEEKLKHDGAIFVWDPNEDNQASPAEVRARFAKMGKVRIMHFAWMRNKDMPPTQITVAFLPPTTESQSESHLP